MKFRGQGSRGSACTWRFFGKSPWIPSSSLLGSLPAFPPSPKLCRLCIYTYQAAIYQFWKQSIGCGCLQTLISSLNSQISHFPPFIHLPLPLQRSDSLRTLSEGVPYVYLRLVKFAGPSLCCSICCAPCKCEFTQNRGIQTRYLAVAHADQPGNIPYCVFCMSMYVRTII